MSIAAIPGNEGACLAALSPDRRVGTRCIVDSMPRDFNAIDDTLSYTLHDLIITELRAVPAPPDSTGPANTDFVRSRADVSNPSLHGMTPLRPIRFFELQVLLRQTVALASSSIDIGPIRAACLRSATRVRAQTFLFS